MKPKRKNFADRHPAFSEELFRAQQLLNGNLVYSGQFHNLSPARKIPQ